MTRQFDYISRYNVSTTACLRAPCNKLIFFKKKKYDKTVLEDLEGSCCCPYGLWVGRAYWQESRASEKLRMNDRGRLVWDYSLFGRPKLFVDSRCCPCGCDMSLPLPFMVALPIEQNNRVLPNLCNRNTPMILRCGDRAPWLVTENGSRGTSSSRIHWGKGRFGSTLTFSWEFAIWDTRYW